MVEKATSALAALESLLPRLMLRFPPGGTGAAVALDGVPADVKPEGIEIDPGEHRIVVTSAGNRPFEQTFQIAQGQRRELLVEMTPLTDARPVGQASFSKPADPTKDVGLGPPLPVWILGGAGVAAAAVGLVVRARGQSDYDDASRDCSDARCTTNEAAMSGNSARDRMIAGNIVLGVGGAAIAGAGLWWILSATESPRTSETRALSVRAQASTDGGWVRLSGAF
jgi:hypothetical protein